MRNAYQLYRMIEEKIAHRVSPYWSHLWKVWRACSGTDHLEDGWVSFLAPPQTSAVASALTATVPNPFRYLYFNKKSTIYHVQNTEHLLLWLLPARRKSQYTLMFSPNGRVELIYAFKIRFRIFRTSSHGAFDPAL